MKKRLQHVITGACAVGVTLTLGLAAAPVYAEGDEYEVLVVGETLGFRHSHIDETTNAIIALGEEHGFGVDVWDPPQGTSPGQPALTLPTSPFVAAFLGVHILRFNIRGRHTSWLSIRKCRGSG